MGDHEEFEPVSPGRLSFQRSRRSRTRRVPRRAAAMDQMSALVRTIIREPRLLTTCCARDGGGPASRSLHRTGERTLHRINWGVSAEVCLTHRRYPWIAVGASPQTPHRGGRSQLPTTHETVGRLRELFLDMIGVSSPGLRGRPL